jgi:2-polyprenyl-3-methyl-5-hydroxy-6-metoxy-1,4-benzoquinol methylase
MPTTHACMLCGAAEFRTIHQKAHWQYRCCQNCRLVSLHPQPTSRQFQAHYRDYLPHRNEQIGQWEAMMRPVNRQSAHLIEVKSHTGGQRLLDVGCGYGFFLREMRSRGWNVAGVEISQTGRRHARDSGNIQVFSKPLERLALDDQSFDVVTLFYVIEHVLKPRELLTEVHRILKPGGLVLLRWPHSTPIVKMLGPAARKLDLYHTPFHLYDFSPKTMEKMLHLTGFRRIETIIAGHTLPAQRLSRWCSVVSGRLSQILVSLSHGKLLLPGVSKTTLAYK